MKSFFAIAIILCAGISQLQALPAQVMIIRHAEKPPQGDSLSTKGNERAVAFVPFFMETKDLLLHGTPAAIYVIAESKTDHSTRTFDTVKPLADALKLTLKNTYQKEDFKRMVDEIMKDSSYNGKTVLICWEHDYIPEIARAFKALQTPSKWVNDAYDRVWILTFSNTGRATFQDFPQRLMFGDSPR